MSLKGQLLLITLALCDAIKIGHLVCDAIKMGHLATCSPMERESEAARLTHRQLSEAPVSQVRASQGARVHVSQLWQLPSTAVKGRFRRFLSQAACQAEELRAQSSFRSFKRTAPRRSVRCNKTPGGAGTHTGHTRGARAHTGTRITQTNLTTILRY